MDGAIIQFIISRPDLAYALLFVGMFFEGDIILFTTLYLSYQGILSYYIAIPIVLGGVISGDIGWYWIGWNLEKRFPQISRWVFFVIRPLDRIFIKHPLKTIVISKFAYGFNHAALMRAGSLKLPFKRFIRAELIASLCWMIIFGGLGYIWAASFPLIKQSLQSAENSLLLGILVVFLIIHFVSWICKLFISRELDRDKMKSDSDRP